MNILGIHLGHDACAALVRDGEIVADVAEERFTRIKHQSGLPRLSVDYCLNAGGISGEDVDVIAVATINPVPDLHLLFDGLPRQKKSRLVQIQDIIKKRKGFPLRGVPRYFKKWTVSPKVELDSVEHHLAHAASAYYTSGHDEKQLIATIDGEGDGFSTCLWRGEGGRIEPLEKFGTESSTAIFYGIVTEGLGWWHGDGEGKTMGLAPYGDPSDVAGILDGYYPKFENGCLISPADYGQFYQIDQSGALHHHYGLAEDMSRLVECHGREQIAAEAQRIIEEQISQLIFPWLNREGTSNLSCAGGLFLNVKLNQRIWETGKVARHHIFPNAGDSGLAVGAALYAWHHRNPGAKNQILDHLYRGPEYSNDEIETVLKTRNLNYRRVEDIESEVADRLAKDQIVAWFQGRMESGPRALGNRSILMSANRAENKDIINSRVKFREGFRPFCPSMHREKKEHYLENPRDEFFMITSFTCPEPKRKRIPAVVHADNTLRPQTVSQAMNPKYWRLIDEFGTRTGEHLLLNTSLNVMGEPIVSHPHEAIRCFYDSGLDCLAMGDFLLEKVQ
ncbi:MAG: carbamoyltransferase C-terminal domain-containing protein [Verrucomicrobiota bacterium]